MIVVVFIIPGWQRFLVVRADTQHLQEINAEIDTLTKKRDEIVAQISAITKDNFQRLDQILPSRPEGPEFLVTLQRLAFEHGLRLEKLTLSETLSTKPKIATEDVSKFTPAGTEIKKVNYQALTVSMEVNGTYEGFKNFLHELESYIRITDIDTLTLAPATNGFDFKLSVKTYYQ